MKKPSKKAKKSNGKQTSLPRREPTEAEIRERAHALYLARGGGEGHQLEDWLAAERELRRGS
jgi:hypothetical protein